MGTYYDVLEVSNGATQSESVNNRMSFLMKGLKNKNRDHRQYILKMLCFLYSEIGHLQAIDLSLSEQSLNFAFELYLLE